MKVMRPLAVGTEIKIVRKDTEKDEDAQFEMFTVIATYTHHHLVESKRGFRMCITNAELLQRGLVEQDNIYERERRFPRLKG